MFIVIEIQYTAGQPLGVLKYVYTTREEAEQNYHIKLSYAAVASTDTSTVLLLDRYGSVLKADRYQRNSEPNSEE